MKRLQEYQTQHYLCEVLGLQRLGNTRAAGLREQHSFVSDKHNRARTVSEPAAGAAVVTDQLTDCPACWLQLT